ncbi:MAG: hypothetical protein II899_05880 [Bacteroidales bacterium]|nr:hypothetical protein [Bacteroidales bacterium]
MEKFFRLTNQALEVLKTPEVKLQLMLFFEVNDARTIESYLKDNVPNGPLMNICVRDLILEYVPSLTEHDLYHRMTKSEMDAINKTKQRLRRNLTAKPSKKENDGQDN